MKLVIGKPDDSEVVLAEQAGGAWRPNPNLAAELATFLFVTEGFAGNATDYGDPRNSLLDDVLDRRLGIPITLSLLMMEVGRRCGLQMHGVGMPGTSPAS